MTKVLVAALLMLCTSAGLSTGAVWLLCGTPWAMISGSVWAFACGVVLVRGAANNG